MTNLNAQAKTVRAERHSSSALWLIRATRDGKILNSAMSYEWAARSMADWIDFETRHAIAV
jgi:hypothetical protein